MIWQAVNAGLAFFQREAGYTRSGSHNTRVHGRETGKPQPRPDRGDTSTGPAATPLTGVTTWPPG